MNTVDSIVSTRANSMVKTLIQKKFDVFEKLKEGHSDCNMSNEPEELLQKALDETSWVEGNQLSHMLQDFYFPQIIIGAS